MILRFNKSFDFQVCVQVFCCFILCPKTDLKMGRNLSPGLVLIDCEVRLEVFSLFLKHKYVFHYLPFTNEIDLELVVELDRFRSFSLDAIRWEWITTFAKITFFFQCA